MALGLGAEESTGPKGLVAHEWGTFTSVQGADGVLLDWRPLETSKLPNFVYNWQNPGLNRRSAGFPGFGKGIILTLQRMETPVIYFYSEHEESVDVAVKFPKGLITEWYPQAAKIGPSMVPVPAAVARIDNYAGQAGINPGFRLASLFDSAALTNSEVRWKHVMILPDHGDKVKLVRDSSGSHYFAARETDAAYLRLDSLERTNPQPELEKFLFYRGVGNFATPLRVTMDGREGQSQRRNGEGRLAESDAGEKITLANTGVEGIKHLYLLRVENGRGQYSRLDILRGGETWSARIEGSEQLVGLEELSRKLGADVAASLCSEGLYRREAEAMVKTWKDSWFAEDGVRVLYVLSREWTDRTLPITIRPTPKELVRVMVGRAEVLTPRLEQRLAEDVLKAGKNEAEGKEDLKAELKRLGRFGQPALALAMRGANPATSQAAWALYEASTNGKNANNRFE